jgi:hypothetical protein
VERNGLKTTLCLYIITLEGNRIIRVPLYCVQINLREIFISESICFKLGDNIWHKLVLIKDFRPRMIQEQLIEEMLITKINFCP